MVDKWMKRLKLMRISKYAIIICLLLSIIFAGFTIYGANTGNFNVYVQGSDVNLAIYMTDDKSDLGAHHTVPTLSDMYDTTFSEIPADIAYRGSEVLGLGSKNAKSNKYLAFSLCLVNQTERAVDYNMALTVNEVRAGADGGNIVNALRVAVIVGNQPTTAAKIYAAAEESEENRQKLEEGLKEYGEYPSKTIDFISQVQLIDEDYYGLEQDEEVKFTFVLWLEGCDEDCKDALFGSKIKMRLDFTGR